MISPTKNNRTLSEEDFSLIMLHCSSTHSFKIYLLCKAKLKKIDSLLTLYVLEKNGILSFRNYPKCLGTSRTY